MFTFIVDRADPFCSVTALHFQDLFRRYGSPIYVLNLIKAICCGFLSNIPKTHEKNPRETTLLGPFSNAINFMNSILPSELAIQHRHWDFSHALKT